ncbi:MAG TPA: hypothetical protein VMH05_02220 [Bryobacteraceae bacterium]|nr:hypothetical protein [Bryobacteraceae bacterium]
MEPTDPFEVLVQKKQELERRAGRLNPEGLKEFVQLAEEACSLREINPPEAERLRFKASDLIPAVEEATERAIAIRDRIRAQMMGHAADAMETYSEVLKELAK